MKIEKMEAVEVFRQFAWNLAGSLVVPKAPRPVAPGGKK